MTGDVISNRYGIEFTEAELASWPEELGEKFIPAPEVKEIGLQLIDKFRNDLKNVPIAYVFKRKASKSSGHIVLGQAKSESDLEKALHSFQAVVIIAYDMWVGKSKDEKARLVFHELEHLFYDMEKAKINIVPHPVEEFPSVMKVFGPLGDAQIDLISAYKKFCSDNGSTISKFNLPEIG